MVDDAPRPEVDNEVRAYVEDALLRLLTPNELERWDVRWELNQGRWQLLVEVVAGGERYVGFVTERYAEYPVAQGLDAFTDGLEDFISESRFAWGQRRELHERPWRKQNS